ncbi:MAG: hypothetical protein FJY65_12580 [Calditrichaeota bacterium]|nr:hypothetical protein [Calditrichota bacterium]
MKLYKITNIDGKTRAGEINETEWGDGVTHKATGTGGKLCSDGFIHAYEHPYIAVLMNPVHGHYTPFLLWEAEGEIAIRDGQKKCGCKELTTIRQIPIPILTKEQIVEIAIRCAMEVYKEPSFTKWANNWLNNVDRMIAVERDVVLNIEVASASEREKRAAMSAIWAAEWGARDLVAKLDLYAANAMANAVNFKEEINLIQIIEKVTGVKDGSII